MYQHILYVSLLHHHHPFTLVLDVLHRPRPQCRADWQVPAWGECNEHEGQRRQKRPRQQAAVANADRIAGLFVVGIGRTQVRGTAVGKKCNSR